MDASTPHPDINEAVAAVLRDMADVQESKQRQWGYRQAAHAVRVLDTPIDELILPGGKFPKIAHVGPSSTKIILEVLGTGRSATVEAAIDRGGQRADVEQRRSFRQKFLSRAAVLRVLDENGRAGLAGYRGDFQMHSTWSDGTQTLTDIAAACLARGYTHAAVTDHSAGLKIARGVSMERFAEQAIEIADINERCADRFRLLRGVEANIGADGAVDIDPDDRGRFDIVLAAPHSGLRSPAPQTDRMLAAVTSPGVHILAHPRGRKYGERPGIAADWPRVFAAAADHGVAVEIDGDPHRQDLDFDLARQALDAGCLIALDSDAHAVSELAYAEIAMAHAVLAAIPEDRIINCWPLDRLIEWADSRRQA